MRVLSTHVCVNDFRSYTSVIRIKLTCEEQAMIGSVHRLDVRMGSSGRSVAIKIRNVADLSAYIYEWFGEGDAISGFNGSKWITPSVRQVRKCGRREYIVRVDRVRKP